MKKQRLLLSSLLLAISVFVYGQIPDGSKAPDFNCTDLNGNSYNLYQLLDQRKTVFLDISATWCGPCWNYHNTHALKTVWDDYGPPGTNEAFVFFAEGDPSTNQACLYGPSGCVGGTQGNWVAGTPYPIIHQQGPSIANSYQISYYPTIFCICPFDSLVYEAGQLPASMLMNFKNDKCKPPQLVVNLKDLKTIRCHGSNTGAIDITPSGGVKPYTYAWSNGATTQDLNNIPAGTYTVTISGDYGTVGTRTFDVEGPSAPLTLQVESTTPVGCNGILGSATVTAEGGWGGNYTFNWQNGQQGATAYNLAAGNHVVSVTDENQCKVSITVNMAPVTYPTAAIAEPPVLTCSPPSIQLNGSGSSAGPEFDYQWFASAGGNIVSGANTPTPTVNAAGNYTLQVTNIQTTCASFASRPVTANQTPPSADAGPSQHISCIMPQTTLQGTASSGANFQYLWTSSDGGRILSGETTLSPVVDAIGTYTLKVTDVSNGCTQTAATTVTGTAPPSLATSGGTINCYASSVTLATATNAVSPTFSWTGPNDFTSSAQSPTVAVSGSYVVVVTDSITTCTSTATANVTVDNAAPGASATGNTLTCIVLSAGIYASTPDTNAIFAWTGPNGFASVEQNPIVSDAGAYLLVVTDTLNGCTSTASAWVAQDNAPPAAEVAAPGNLNCHADQLQLNGTASAQGPNISYAWTAADGGNIVSGEDTQTPLVDAPGTYLLLVSNSQNGCTNTTSVTVAQSPPMAASLDQVAPAQCYGSADGQATVSATGGNGTYQYQWSNGATSASAFGLVAGQYLAVVTDGENCAASVAVTIEQPPLLQANASATAQTAFGLADGTATAEPTGGIAPYSFVWGNGETTQSIADLLPGNYSVVVTDHNGCTALQTVTVNNYNCTLAATISGTNVRCNGAADGTATVSANVSAAVLAFVWSNGASTESVQNLSAGLYTVLVTDEDNCPALLSIQISEPPQLMANVSTTAESALGANDGAASANPVGGTAPYQYEWSNGASTQAIANLSPGTYTVVITDANGCTTEESKTVNAFLCSISSQTSVVNVSCAGASNGAATVSLIGGEAPFTYTWSNGATAASISNLSGGTYSVSVTDANGCAFSASVSVAEPLPFSPLDVQIAHPDCPNQATGAATASISGGTEPYQFLWSNGNIGNTLSNALAGTYTVQVTDANGCQSSANVVLISSDSQAPVVSAQSASVSLSTNGAASVTLATIGAQFSDNCGVASATVSPAQFDCHQIGQQTVVLTVTDLSGNTATATAVVNVVDNISPTLTCPANIVACPYDNIVNYASPVAEDNCLLAGNGAWTVNGPASGSEFPVGQTVVLYTYTDASGNSSACSFSVTVSSPVLFTDVQVNNDVNGQQVGSINIVVEGGTGPYQFAWTNDKGVTVSTSEDAQNLGEGTYGVQVTDANGCIYTKEGIRVENTVSVKEPAWLTNVSIQPNPTSGVTNVVFSRPVAGTLEMLLLDATGRVVFSNISEQETVVPIDCTNLPGGVYTLRFRTGHEVGARKLVVTH